VLETRLVGIAILLTLAVALPATAQARSDTEQLVRVISPTQGQGVFPSGQAVKVAVRGNARLTVHVDRQDVTSATRLRQVRRSGAVRILRGRLPQRLLRGGPKAVTFKVRARAGGRHDADDVLVQPVTRQPSFMSLRLRRSNGGRAPVEATVRTRTHRIWLRARLNGRPVERVAKSRRLGERRLLLTRTEGLRPGRNVLEVATNSAGGRGDVERRVFRLPRAAVIPGVQVVDHLRVRRVARLDAGPTHVPRKARRGGMRYRWRLVARPRGSRTRLRGAAHRVARFRPDVPGRYSVRLIARPRPGKGRKGRAAAAQAAGGLVKTLDVQAPIPPYGLALSTDPSKGITLAGNTTPLPASQAGISLVAIDSLTGAITRTIQIPGLSGGIVTDVNSLVDYLDALDDPTQIVAMVSRGGGNAEWTGEGITTLALSLLTFGVDNDDAYDLASAIVDGSAFALVGSPGSVPGAAVVNGWGGAGGAGVLQGRLRLTGLSTSLTGVLVFEQPDYRTFKLGGGHEPTVVSQINPPAGAQPTNWIDAPTGASTSMQLTIVNAVTLATTASAAVVDTCDDGALSEIANLLGDYADDATQLVLFKMAAPPACPGQQRYDLATFSKQLAALGSNRDLFLRSLQYPGATEFPPSQYPGAEYVFFGGAGVSPVEGSSLITASTPSGGQVAVSSPTVAGTLSKSNRGQWVPVASHTSDQLTGAMRALATRAPVAFGYPTDVAAGSRAEYVAAEGRLFDLLVAAGVVCTPGPDCGVPSGVRINYANQELLDDLSTAQSELDCKADGTTDGTLSRGSGATFSQAQLNALQAAVCVELAQLSDVHDKLFDSLRTNVYTALEADSTLDLLSASDSYVGFLEDEHDQQLDQSGSFLGISGESAVVLGDLFTAATDVADYTLAPETGGASIFATQALGDLFTAGGDTIGLASGATGVGETPDKVAPTLVTVGNLFSYIQSAYGYAQKRMVELEALINSDPTKLADASAQVASGAWDMEKTVGAYQAYQILTFQMRTAALQYMLPRMLSADASPCDPGGSESDPTTYVAWTRFDAEGGNPPSYLSPSPHRLRSVHLDSADASKLAPRLFDAPFSSGYDPIAQGPASAALARSPFFMWQVAPTTDSSNDACTDT